MARNNKGNEKTTKSKKKCGKTPTKGQIDQIDQKETVANNKETNVQIREAFLNGKKQRKVSAVKRKIVFKQDETIDQNNNATVKAGKSPKLQIASNAFIDQTRSRFAQKNSNDEVTNLKSKFVKESTNKGDGICIDVDADDDLDYVDDVLGDGNDILDEEIFAIPEEIDNALVSQPSDLETELNLDESATANSCINDDILKDLPHLKSLVNQLLDERMKQVSNAQSQGESSKSTILTRPIPDKQIQVGMEQNRLEQNVRAKEPTTNQTVTGNCTGVKIINRNIIKSPSDTMIYAPALVKHAKTILNEKSPVNLQHGAQLDPRIAKTISNFIESVRVETAEAIEPMQTVRNEVQPHYSCEVTAQHPEFE